MPPVRPRKQNGGGEGRRLRLVAGVDIGNVTTEVAVARLGPTGPPEFLASAIARTTGVKGTLPNVRGVVMALQDAVARVGLRVQDLSLIRLNEATPVITDVAMETITETIITESTMIGHDPSTPGGAGLGVGITVPLEQLDRVAPGERVVVVVGGTHTYDGAAALINRALDRGVQVTGAIMQKDEAVLLNNRLGRRIPVVDEVALIELVPPGVPAAVEVAEPGRAIQTLSNPYGIATIFGLGPEETKMIVPIARALIGNRSAVVLKTPQGQVRERRIPAGVLTVEGERARLDVNIEDGAEAVMRAVERAWPLRDVRGEPGTNVGGMMQRVRQTMAELTGQAPAAVRIQDVLAVDTMAHQTVRGGLAGEFAAENAVALAAMVKTTRLPMEQVASALERETGVAVELGGVEAEMAVLGALTTPGVDRPLAVLDLGGGSTDAAFIARNGEVRTVHLAGAGEMVTMLIDSELALRDRELAEKVKRCPLAKVESLFHMRLEDGTVHFFREALEPRLFGRVVLLEEDGTMTPVATDQPLERIRAVRRTSKERVFLTNSLRALEKVVPTGNVRHLDFVVLVGGSALDFEIPEMITRKLAEYGVVAGRANVRGREGPRNAVATGLVLACGQ